MGRSTRDKRRFLFYFLYLHQYSEFVKTIPRRVFALFFTMKTTPATRGVFMLPDEAVLRESTLFSKIFRQHKKRARSVPQIRTLLIIFCIFSVFGNFVLRPEVWFPWERHKYRFSVIFTCPNKYNTKTKSQKSGTATKPTSSSETVGVNDGACMRLVALHVMPKKFPFSCSSSCSSSLNSKSLAPHSLQVVPFTIHSRKWIKEKRNSVISPFQVEARVGTVSTLLEKSLTFSFLLYHTFQFRSSPHLGG